MSLTIRKIICYFFGHRFTTLEFGTCNKGRYFSGKMRSRCRRCYTWREE